MIRHMQQRRGFTLVEILIVLLVLSILMSVVVASFSGVDREQALRGYVERLALKIELARDRALQSNHEWGLYVEQDRVRFGEYDEANDRWRDRSEKPFHTDDYEQPLRFNVTVESALGLNERTSSERPTTARRDDELPSVVLFSSGETMPFSLTVEPVAWESVPWLIESDGFTRATAIRSDAR